MSPYFRTSANPAESSRCGNVAKVEVSAITARGWWKAPIDLCQQGRGYLNEADPALITGGGEPRHVPHHAPAERHQGAITSETRLKQGIEDPVPDLHRLVLLAVGQHHLADVITLQRSANRFQIQGRDRLVGHDHDLRAEQMRTVEIRIREQAGTDVNGISTRPEGDGKAPGHGVSPIMLPGRERCSRPGLPGAVQISSDSKRREISLTTELVPRFSVDTTISATWR